MKKSLTILLLVAFFNVAISFCQTGVLRAETVTLKAVTAWPKNASDNKSLDFFLESVAQQVAKKYPGELKINLVGGPEAVKITDQVHAAQTGMVDIVHTTNAYYVSLATGGRRDEAFELHALGRESQRGLGILQ